MGHEDPEIVHRASWAFAIVNVCLLVAVLVAMLVTKNAVLRCFDDHTAMPMITAYVLQTPTWLYCVMFSLAAVTTVCKEKLESRSFAFLLNGVILVAVAMFVCCAALVFMLPFLSIVRGMSTL